MSYVFGNEILNAKQLAAYLQVSTSLINKMVKSGMPYHQLSEKGRKYYVAEEVKEWLLTG